MDNPETFLLRLYRTARDTPVQEFPALALEMLKAMTQCAPPGASRGEYAQADSDAASRQAEGLTPAVEQLLHSHCQEAIRINALLQPGSAADGQPAGDAVSHALLGMHGELRHCSARFAALLGSAHPGMQLKRLPDRLLRSLLRGQTARTEGGAVEILPVKLGDAWLLTARMMPMSRRLTGSEFSIARRFGAGHSCKEIADEVGLAPATVRNVVQNIYRKLGINSKATLAKLLLEEEAPGHAASRDTYRM